jgi:hypothetical protein
MCSLGALTLKIVQLIGPFLASRFICRFNLPDRLTDEMRGRSGAFMHETVTDLTAEGFRSIIEAPVAEAYDGSQREQRRTPRTPMTVQAALMPFSDRFALETIVAPIRNVSRGGFGFLHERQIPLGEQFAMVLPEASGRPPLVILCTVAYWQPLAEDLFSIGARFCRVLRAGTTNLPLIFEDPISGERLENVA